MSFGVLQVLPERIPRQQTLVDIFRGSVFLLSGIMPQHSLNNQWFYMLKSMFLCPLCPGGWYCFNKENCDSRYETMRRLMSSSKWPQTKTGQPRRAFMVYYTSISTFPPIMAIKVPRSHCNASIIKRAGYICAHLQCCCN